MEIIRRVVNLITFAFILLTGISILAIPLYIDKTGDVIGKTLPGNRDGWVGTGASVIAFALVFALLHSRRRKAEHFLVYDKEGGPVSISTEAISDYLLKLADEFPSVVRMRPKVLPFRNEISVQADLKVRGGPQIHEICELVQRRIRETLQEGLGIKEVRNVEISVREIYPESKSSQ